MIYTIQQKLSYNFLFLYSTTVAHPENLFIYISYSNGNRHSHENLLLANAPTTESIISRIGSIRGTSSLLFLYINHFLASLHFSPCLTGATLIKGGGNQNQQARNLYTKQTEMKMSLFAPISFSADLK